ncbi:hypothetical protein ACFWOT_27265 [Streptomyces sp. NPDC058440]|uniref:hypothetical protein n=1 Tax=Streptomyces sp. NPDC058440 TaxID=3346501 RepID=UPI00364AE286
MSAAAVSYRALRRFCVRAASWGAQGLIALAEGLRESAESWAGLLRDWHRHGMRDPAGSGAD